MARLEIDIAVPLRDFALAVALTVGAETVALTGPSGAGKTTVLRALAGLHRPGAGRIALDGEPWFDAAAGVDLPPERRRVGLVHQEGALFPHLSVRDNVAFGARDPARVDELLARLRIAPLARERPGRISGGERQRVALARALARDPGVLALDEPLSALDAATRTAVRAELQDVLAELGLPALLVTHDFADAAVLADRIGVLAHGRLRQIGSPHELVERPADAFVAQLTGSNVLWGEADGTVVALAGGGHLGLPQPARGRVALAIAPWHVRLHDAVPESQPAVAVRVAAVTPEHGRVRVRTDRLVAEVPEAGALARGDVAWAVASPEHVRVLP